MALTRQVSITYNGLTLGGSSAVYRLTDPFAFKIGVATISLESHVIVSGTTESDFRTNEAALLNAFKGAKGALVVTLDGNTRYSFSHSAYTGMSAMAEANKPGSPIDTDLSALYVVSVTMERPWDYSGEGGLRVANIAVATGPNGGRTLQISGQYSATPSNSAITNFNNGSTGALAYGQGWLSTFAILNSDLMQQTAIPNKDNTVCDFSLMWVELAHEKTEDGQDLTFKDPNLTVFINQHQFGSSSSEARLPVEMEITYKAVVLFTTPIDLANTTDLKAFITTTLEPKLLSYARSVSPVNSPLVILERKPFYSAFDNACSLTLRIMSYPTSLIQQEIIVDEQADEGEMITPVWDGKEFSKEVQKITRTWDRKLTIHQVLLGDVVRVSSDLVVENKGGTVDSGIQIVADLDPIDLVGKERFRVIGRQRTRFRQRQGLVGLGNETQEIQLIDETWSVYFTRIDEPGDGLQNIGGTVSVNEGPSAPGAAITNTDPT